jgi:hypothetical protein
MSLETQVNKINCGAGGTVGAGLAGCRIDWTRTTLIGVIKQKGYKFTEEISLDYIRELEQQGIVEILQGVVSFADQTADDAVITREGSGIKKVAGKMPYEKVATFDNGINFQKAISTLSNYNGYDLFFMDDNNTLWFTSTKAGEYKGFTTGMFEAGKYLNSNGTDAASQTITFQLTNRYEIDELISWVTGDNLDFTYEDLQGVNEVKITVNPIVAGTSIVVSAFLLDGTHPVEGLLFGDFSVDKNGLINDPTVAVYNATDKTYTLTVPSVALADIVDVSLNGIILTPLGTLYKSNTATAIVA